MDFLYDIFNKKYVVVLYILQCLNKLSCSNRYQQIGLAVIYTWIGPVETYEQLKCNNLQVFTEFTLCKFLLQVTWLSKLHYGVIELFLTFHKIIKNETGLISWAQTSRNFYE